ncbi:EF-hand domain-containing protein [Salegentibacter sp. JZCK2]|uniref:DUF7282 domain-containing protein n=1 Tax=Salegentibacter tibetensis TaxID=2873600 RepID=UPI001CCFA73A|nr:EF-hand domain-containing protein [Salegentibacter tibetensis]MBZ9731428.1 EF-hand domain-containing protein [Salegentibacter tibetensis]
MKNSVNNLTKYFLYFTFAFVATSLTGCSDDDDGFEPFEPTGFFEVGEQQILTGNTLTLESIDVDQDSWLVAVRPGDENTNNFISDPTMLQEGSNTDVQLTLNQNSVANGDQIVLMIFGDDPNEGIQGQFDEPDRDNPILETKTITVFTEDSNEAAFINFDQNRDGFLDQSEFMNTFNNDFDGFDIDNDGFHDNEEFFNNIFAFTDADDDNFIDEDEFNLGFDGFFGNHIDNNFSTFDSDADGFLNDAEFDAAFADSTMFGTFDADDDNFVTETEFNTGIFNDRDFNDDDRIDADEFNPFNNFVRSR